MSGIFRALLGRPAGCPAADSGMIVDDVAHRGDDAEFVRDVATRLPMWTVSQMDADSARTLSMDGRLVRAWCSRR
jgi:hypothetical protein